MELPKTVEEYRDHVTVAASKLSPEAQISESRFHGSKPPKYNLSEERPWHRVAAYLFATGATSAKEVAQITETSEPTIRNLLRQPWFQERVTKLLADNGGKDIMALLKAEQFNSLVTLIEIRDNAKAPAVVRANISRDILDRTIGKPVQRVEMSDTPVSDDPVAEARRLEEELARTRDRVTQEE